MIATDGVWRYLTPEKVGSIVVMYKKTFHAETAANEIVKVAAQRWNLWGVKMDDITAVVIYLNRDQIIKDYEIERIQAQIALEQT